MYLEGRKSTHKRDTSTPMCVAALGTGAKLWNQSNCPRNDEWIKKIWCMNTAENHSAIKNRIMLFAGNG
jgi:hypothetical protein